eukprot:m.45726 g.45726  ORF g.45726 m.45726 type:complete len:447 (+) comp20043_c0_seq3:93-1433(+)
MAVNAAFGFDDHDGCQIVADGFEDLHVDLDAPPTPDHIRRGLSNPASSPIAKSNATLARSALHDSQGASDSVCWPDPFPDFLGLNVQRRKDKASGYTFLVVEQVEQFRMEFSTKNASFARAIYKEKCTKVLRDLELMKDPEYAQAHKTYEEKRVNNGHSIHLYFRVDREQKLLKVLCYHFCFPSTCTNVTYQDFYNTIMAAQSKDMLNKTNVLQAGEWWYPKTGSSATETTDEYWLNAWNTSMFSINFESSQVNVRSETDYVTKNMTLYFPRPVATDSICPGLVPTPIDITATQLEDAEKYLTAPDSAFRDATDDTPQKVFFDAHINSVNSVETLGERFTARLTIHMWWQITKKDAVDYGTFAFVRYVQTNEHARTHTHTNTHIHTHTCARAIECWLGERCKHNTHKSKKIDIKCVPKIKPKIKIKIGLHKRKQHNQIYTYTMHIF